ncbi:MULTISPECIES: putative lipid II flippase FtsW [unclassified Thioalkalivibrio]|uniref:putative lipid II flippase FtsW n=1 Tax=unclassified Thioalkalivibrio TaxID=2621013 RepID=UPI00039FBC2D|nr:MULTISPECIES: putative lipid II flippase FtsW [unclassified Thioalkalivibrio]
MSAPVSQPTSPMVRRLQQEVDLPLLALTAALVALGLVMVASASMEMGARDFGNAWHFLQRQVLFAALGTMAAVAAWNVPLARWERAGPWLLALFLLILVVVLLPGVGRTVNGATRWIPLGAFNLQVAELAKLLVVMYLAGYIVRHYSTLRLQLAGFVRPLVVLGAGTVLLLLQPDFGGAAIMLAIGMGMLFLAGARLSQFLALGGTIAAGMAVAAVAAPYRMARLTAFLDPWQDPFASGFQLTQSLIAIGSGGVTGSGLGGSVQKLFYLPEAHNDFLFAVFAEEFGFFGVLVLIALFAGLVWRCLRIGLEAQRSGHAFGAHLSFGVAIWLGLQAALNMGVNMGLLPTKGMTLPFLSYGGSSLIVSLIAVGLVLRVAREARTPAPAPVPRRRSRAARQSGGAA